MTSRLSEEFQRLYQLPGAALPVDRTFLKLVGADGLVRTMVLGLSGPADWPALSAVWRGVQSDLALPAPAIAVNGVDAYELWFSLAEPVPLALAAGFLDGLRQRYLGDVKPARVQMRPSLGIDGANQSTLRIPAPQGNTGNWAAFVAPDLAAVFGDEPLLDLPPGEDAQAELLSRLANIRSAEFEAALARLQATAPDRTTEKAAPAIDAPAQPARAYEASARQFLFEVMNDATVPIASRIEAAKGLL